MIETQKVITLRVEIVAANIEDLAVHHDNADALQIIHGHAVFQTMRTAGVGADIAGKRAGKLARRIGRVEEALGRGGLRDADIGDAGLDAGDAIDGVDFQHAVHARDAEHDRILQRQGTAAERGAGAAGHHLDAVLVAIAQDLADFLRRGRQQDGQRYAAIGGQRVGFIGAAALGIGDQKRFRHELAQVFNDLIPAREHRLIRLW